MKKIFSKYVVMLIAVLLSAGVCLAQDPLKKPQKQSSTQSSGSKPAKKQTRQGGGKHEAKHSSAPKVKTGVINGHEWVDLGLPSGLKWATCNIGASKPEMRGDYFAWGDTSVKSKYTSGNCPAKGKSFSWLRGQGYLDQNGDLCNPYDAASKNWGASWRIPTFAEIKELMDCTTYEWTNLNGTDGCLLKSKKNGASIFLPAAGWYRNDKCKEFGENGGYWAATGYGDDDGKAYIMGFNPQGICWYIRGRDYGRSIRPVSN